MEDGIRQGNENDEIDVFTYVTEGTFDAYLYQLVENKQRFISQIMTSKAIVRSAEDIDEKALSYAEIKALAAGNPLIIEKTNLDAEVSKLKLLKQSYLSQIYMLEDSIVKYYPIEIKKNEDLIKNIQKDIEVVKTNTITNEEDKFSPMILKGKQYNEKEEAGKMILEICNPLTGGRGCGILWMTNEVVKKTNSFVRKTRHLVITTKIPVRRKWI